MISPKCCSIPLKPYLMILLLYYSRAFSFCPWFSCIFCGLYGVHQVTRLCQWFIWCMQNRYFLFPLIFLYVCVPLWTVAEWMVNCCCCCCEPFSLSDLFFFLPALRWCFLASPTVFVAFFETNYMNAWKWLLCVHYSHSMAGSLFTLWHWLTGTPTAKKEWEPKWHWDREHRN